MVADAAAQLGGIDVLVNNAGIGGPTAPVQDVDADDWEQVLKVDLPKHAIPHLIRSGNGSIIVMSSAAGRFGYPNRSPIQNSLRCSTPEQPKIRPFIHPGAHTRMKTNSTVKWGLIRFI
jgi:NAD(P)-dependent dehydrogenase (short-subunit alcohol dehydrogenase family)